MRVAQEIARMNANQIGTRIVDGISPYLGRTMAQSSLVAHCKRLGIDVQQIQHSQVDRLLQELSLGLNVFIGREKSEKVVRDIRVSLSGAGA